MKKAYTLSFLIALALVFTSSIYLSESAPPPPGGNPVLPTTPYPYQFELPGHIELGNGSWGDPPLPFFDEITDEKATLGRVLFYDTRLSLNDDLSCGSCHKQAASFADDKRFSEGINMTEAARNTPNINDLGWRSFQFLFWDNRESDLGALSLQPALDENELGNNIGTILTRVNQAPFYADLFQDAFGSPDITQERIEDAIEQFMNSMTTFNSRWDQGSQTDFAIFSSAENHGRELFESKCATCHNPPSFGASEMTTFVNNGLDSEFTDLGLGAITGNESQNGIFKSPSLRNITLTAPYMHDGRFETLREVIDFYSEEVESNGNSFLDWGIGGDPSLGGFGFTETEKVHLETFLNTLTDVTFINDPKFSDPFETVATGIAALPLEGVSIYPNPTVEALTIDLPSTEKTIISLTTVNGQKVFTDQTNESTYTLYRNNLINGVYFLNVESEGKMKTMKVLFE